MQYLCSMGNATKEEIAEVHPRAVANVCAGGIEPTKWGWSGGSTVSIEFEIIDTIDTELGGFKSKHFRFSMDFDVGVHGVDGYKVVYWRIDDRINKTSASSGKSSKSLITYKKFLDLVRLPPEERKKALRGCKIVFSCQNMTEEDVRQILSAHY